MKARVRVLYWLDRRGVVDTWFGGVGLFARPSDAVTVVTTERPIHVGQFVEGEQVGSPGSRWKDSYEAAAGKVLVVGVPVPQS